MTIELKVEGLSVESAQLHFVYELQNHGQAAVYPQVFIRDCFEQISNDRSFTSELAQISFVGDRTAVFFAGAVTMILPEGRQSSPQTPLSMRLEPGRAFRTAVRTALPLAEWHIYQQPNRGTPKHEESISRIEVVVAYVTEANAGTVLPRDDHRFLAVGKMNLARKVIDVSPFNVTLLLRDDPDAYRFTDYPVFR